MTSHVASVQVLEGLHVPVPRVRHAALALACLIVPLQLGGGVIGEAAATLALPMALAIGWACDRRYLSILIVLCIPAFAVSPEGGGLFSFADVVAQVSLAGGSVGAPLAAMIGAFCRVCWQAASGREALRSVVPFWALALFLLAFVPVLLGALDGRALGLNRWTTAIRSMLAVAGLFWGRLLVRDLDDGRWALLSLIRTTTVAGSAVFLLGALSGHFTFLLLGLATGFAPVLFRERRMVAGTAAAAVALYGVLFMTLSTAGIVVVTSAALLLASMPVAAMRRWLLRWSVAVGIVLGVGLIATVYALRSGTLPAALLVPDAGGSLIAYAQFKLLADRGPLWLAAIEQIVAGPWVVVPAGRPLLPEIFGSLTLGEWEFGAHNSVLELTRNAGVVAAAGALVVIIIAMFRAARVLVRSPDASHRALAAAFVGIALVGISTNDFPVAEVGFFLWLLGGIVIGLDVTRTTPVRGTIEASR